MALTTRDFLITGVAATAALSAAPTAHRCEIESDSMTLSIGSIFEDRTPT